MSNLIQKSFGEIDIEFNKNSVSKFYQKGASKALLPNNYREYEELVLINTSGGITSGDEYLYKLNLIDSRVSISTQAAEKIYSGLGKCANLNIDINIVKSDVLWLPQEIIFFNNCNFARRINLNLDIFSNLVMCETTIFGRTSMQETVERGYFSDLWQINLDEKIIHAEAINFSGDIKEALTNKTNLNDKYVVNTILITGKEFINKAELLDINKYENKNVKIAISQWDNKILIRSIGKNSYYLKFAIIKILTYFLGDNLPNVWNS